MTSARLETAPEFSSPTLAVPRPPSWPGGALEPQHFQAADQYAEARIAFVVNALSPHAWGFTELRVDPVALAKGLVRVSRAVGRFRSGFPFDIRQASDPLERPIPDSFAERSEMTVFLAVARTSPDAPNVTADGKTPFAIRFARRPADGADDAPQLTPLVRLLFDDEELPAAIERIPVARVRRRGMAVEVDKSFAPPMARMLGGTEIAASVDALIAELKKRQQVLVASRRGNAATVDPSRYSQLRLLSAINRSIAALSLIVVRGEPERLYRKLSTLLGAVAPLAGESITVPEFDHAEPGPAFRELLERLHALIPTVAPDPFVRMVLQRRDATTFQVTAPDPALFRRQLLLVASGVDPRALISQIPALAKISGPTHFSYVVQSAVGGVRLGIEFDPPGALSTGAADVCFRLEQRGDYWEDIIKTGTFMLFLQQAPAELSLTLYGGASP